MPNNVRAKPPNQSRAFLLAFHRCNEKRPLAPGQLEWLVAPAVVCAAFSIELGLKAILTKAGSGARGHDLNVLFNAIPADIQNKVTGLVGITRADFDTSLARASHAFVEWRYVHENAEAMANIMFLEKLAVAVENEVSD